MKKEFSEPRTSTKMAVSARQLVTCHELCTMRRSREPAARSAVCGIAASEVRSLEGVRQWSLQGLREPARIAADCSLPQRVAACSIRMWERRRMALPCLLRLRRDRSPPRSMPATPVGPCGLASATSTAGASALRHRNCRGVGSLRHTVCSWIQHRDTAGRLNAL